MTHSEIKLARSLSQNKFRKEFDAYLIEGAKIVQEWIQASADIRWIICTEDYYTQHQSEFIHFSDQLRIVPYHVIQKISVLKTPPQILSVVNIPKKSFSTINTDLKWHLVLDRIQDPGNLGTVIRLADWMGINEVIISPGSVDIYNPKVIQSTMGSFLRVKMIEMELQTVIDNAAKPLIGTILNGENILQFEKRGIKSGYIFMGNESHGLADDIIKQMTYNITLPSLNSGAESLNIAIAASMVCSRLLY